MLLRPYTLDQCSSSIGKVTVHLQTLVNTFKKSMDKKPDNGFLIQCSDTHMIHLWVVTLSIGRLG